MFEKSKFFAVYVKKDSNNPLEEAVIVKQGFNFFAVIFTSFWALYNKIWWLFFALLCIEGALYYEISHNIESVIFFKSLGFLIQLWLGFEASNLKGKNLEKRGYMLFDVVCASDETEAHCRLFGKFKGLTLTLNKLGS